MCSDLLLGNIIKLKQATIPLGTQSFLHPPNEARPGFSRNGPEFCRKSSGAAQLSAGHSVDGTLLFRVKLNKLQEVCAVTFRYDRDKAGTPSSKHFTDSQISPVMCSLKQGAQPETLK